MKLIFTITAVMLLAAPARSQQIQVQGRTIDLGRLAADYKHQLLSSRPSGAAKTTAILQRVIGESTYDMSSTTSLLTDTISYKYSGPRGSEFFTGGVAYYHDYPPFITIGADVSSFSAPTLKADSIWSWTLDTATQLLQLAEKVTAGYNNMQHIVFYEDRYMLDPTDTSLTQNIYDAQDKLLQLNTLRWDIPSGQWDSSEKRTFGYDGQGRIVKDTLFQYNAGDWDPYLLVQHTFNTSGKETLATLSFYTGTSWFVVLRFDMTYYPDDKTKTVAMSSFTGSALEPVFKDSMAYTAGLDFATESWSYNWNTATGSWDNGTYTTVQTNAQNLPHSFLTSTWDTTALDYLPTQNYILTYNSYDNPEKRYNYTYVAGSPVLQDLHHFYYEEYDDTQGIASVENNLVAVYPNPSGDYVYISVRDPQHKAARIQLTNAGGQLVYSVPAGNAERQRLDLSALAPGTYYLTVLDHKGVLSGRKTILRL